MKFHCHNGTLKQDKTSTLHECKVDWNVEQIFIHKNVTPQMGETPASDSKRDNWSIFDDNVTRCGKNNQFVP